jgi:hypothetical protein
MKSPEFSASEKRHIGFEDLYPIIAILRQTVNLRILDAAGGHGLHAEYLADALECPVDVMDVRPGYIGCGKWIQGSVEEAQNYGQLKYSTVIANNVVHLLHCLESFFRCANLSLIRGGRFLICTRTHEQLRSRIVANLFPGALQNDLSRYPTIHRVVLLLEQAGFSIENIQEVCRHQVVDSLSLEFCREANWSTLRLLERSALLEGESNLAELVRVAGPLDLPVRKTLIVAKTY